ncbi:cyanophycinase [Candidatus Planktophila lacus]|uniref:Type 1 glutamine amidotransferase-like domain-containing protein n=1 Tax=Candidatus Planktophila lacus TaxID=1884913 RepID=UPI000BACD218|nr:Type 1 glutamine amidotransferase-like domain-containing protein [Candidatus Planktophila lacus]ASY25418.1 cyanophycinase [Candidatus Planktophila lacus]
MPDHQPGALALVGSGEYLREAQLLEAELLRFGISRGKSNTYVQIPTAAGKEGDDRLDFWRQRGAEQGARIGCEVKYLPVLTREDAFNEQWIAEIKSAGLIYFSGGDPVHLAEIFVDTPMWQVIVQSWRDGASLAGCSAGAMAFGGKIIGIRRSHISTGLNLLPDIEVIPHYDKFLGWLPDRVTAAIVRKDADTALLGIDENTALVLTDKWRKYGAGNVHILRGEFEMSEELFPYN